MIRRKPWSVELVGVESGTVSPPIRFLRFRTREDAEDWIDKIPSTVHPLTFWRPVLTEHPLSWTWTRRRRARDRVGA